MKSLLACIVFVLMLSDVNAQKTFYWNWHLANDTLRVTARIDNDEKKVISLPAESIIHKFRRAYKIVDELKYKQWVAYQETIALLNDLIVKPFETQLLQSQRIIIGIDSGLLHLPLEFLQIHQKEISIFRPLTFKINELHEKEGNDSIVLRKGFILRDPTSDPEDACTSVFRLYPGSTFRSTYQVKPKNLLLKPNTDFILISAHGFVDTASLQGYVFANEKPITPHLLQTEKLKLVYVDGCQQGINWSYIKVLTYTNSPIFYLGPIVSNDSGESSTNTINWFFSYLKQTADAASALWQTRKKLYRHYKNKIYSLDVINKSFIFRLYKL